MKYVATFTSFNFKGSSMNKNYIAILVLLMSTQLFCMQQGVKERDGKDDAASKVSGDLNEADLVASFERLKLIVSNEKPSQGLRFLTPKDFEGYEERAIRTAQAIIALPKKAKIPAYAPILMLNDLTHLRHILEFVDCGSQLHKKAFSTFINYKKIICQELEKAAGLSGAEAKRYDDQIFVLKKMYLQAKSYEEVKTAELSVSIPDLKKQPDSPIDVLGKKLMHAMRINGQVSLENGISQLKLLPQVHVLALDESLLKQGRNSGEKFVNMLCYLVRDIYCIVDPDKQMLESICILEKNSADAQEFHKVKSFYSGQLHSLSKFDLEALIKEHKINQSMAEKLRKTFKEEVCKSQIFSLADNYAKAAPLIATCQTVYAL